MTATDFADWLTWRTQGIGASDVAAIVRLSPWQTPFSVWVSKVTDPIDDRGSREEFEWGHALEPALARRFERRTGLAVVNAQQRCVHPANPVYRATPDGMAVEFTVDGDESGDEVGPCDWKVTSDWSWPSGPPAYYQCQSQWQQFVTGREVGFVGALHNAKRFEVYTIDRDDRAIELLRDAVDRFWTEHVEPRIPPPLDAAPATGRAIEHLFRSAGAGAVELDADLWARYTAARDARDAAVDAYDLVEHELKLALGDHTEGRVGGERVCTWKYQDRAVRDEERLRDHWPELLDQYMTTTRTRTLRMAKRRKRK